MMTVSMNSLQYRFESAGDRVRYDVVCSVAPPVLPGEREFRVGPPDSKDSPRPLLLKHFSRSATSGAVR